MRRGRVRLAEVEPELRSLSALPNPGDDNAPLFSLGAALPNGPQGPASSGALAACMERVLPPRGWKRWFLFGVLMVPAGVAACMTLFLAVYLWYRSNGQHEFFFSPSHPRAIRTRERGDEIVRAIKKYHQHRGKYPATLDGLRPDFLSRIPEPLYGTGEWSYRVDESPEGEIRFVLAFHAPGRYPVVFFESDVDHWSIDK